MKQNNALAQGLIRCQDCGRLEKMVAKSKNCKLCGSKLHARVPHSFQRTLALLVSSFALYIPANLFPIMTVTQLKVGEPHTIFGGIIALIHGNMLTARSSVLCYLPPGKLVHELQSLALPCLEVDRPFLSFN